MKDEDIVCRCNLVHVKEVKSFREHYPYLSEKYIILALGIGQRCGCCQTKDCPNIDVHFSEVLDEMRQQ